MIPWTMAGLVIASGLCIIRVIIGPSLLDRIAAADAVGLLMIMLLVLLSILTGSPLFLDIALVYSLLLFADFLVIAKYLEKSRRKSNDS